MILHFTSGYHPEADRQTEHTNQTLEQYLWIYCNYQQFNWTHLLSLAKFAYNNASFSTTGLLPFFTNKGFYPQFQLDVLWEIPSNAMREYTSELKEIYKELKQNIAKT